MRAKCLPHLILLDRLDIWQRANYGTPHCLAFSTLLFTFSLLGPNIHLSALFSHTLYIFSPLNVRDQVSHPYKTTGKIIVLYFNLHVFKQKTGREKFLKLMIANILRI
jgi:hypothetical protein